MDESHATSRGDGRGRGAEEHAPESPAVRHVVPDGRGGAHRLRHRDLCPEHGVSEPRIDVSEHWVTVTFPRPAAQSSTGTAAARRSTPEGDEEAKKSIKRLFDAGELEWVPGTQTWRAPDGKMAAQYRERNGHHALLVRENWLKRTLRACGYSMVFGWLGEKRLFDAGSWPRLVGDWMEINAIASLAGGRWTFGQRRLERRRVDGRRRARNS